MRTIRGFRASGFRIWIFSRAVPKLHLPDLLALMRDGTGWTGFGLGAKGSGSFCVVRMCLCKYALSGLQKLEGLRFRC